MKSFSVKNMMQELLEANVTFEPQQRSEIWASDLGKPYIDRFLNMNGVPYTNPATGESLQNFLIGRHVEEGFGSLLKMCAIPYETGNDTDEYRVKVQLEGCLPVVGRPDFIIEVKDWNTVYNNIDKQIENEPEKYKADKKVKLKKLVEKWERDFPNGIERSVFEVKTINSRAFKYLRKKGLVNAYPHYKLQLFTYMKAFNLDKGYLVFIVKDYGKNGGAIHEGIVYRNDKLESDWERDVREFSEYYLNNIEPPLEPIKIDGKMNWRVTYSSYRKMLYNI